METMMFGQMRPRLRCSVKIYFALFVAKLNAVYDKLLIVTFKYDDEVLMIWSKKLNSASKKNGPKFLKTEKILLNVTLQGTETFLGFNIIQFQLYQINNDGVEPVVCFEVGFK